jgi:aminoglycoside phosphotransferase (APT) family kinase protein
MEIDQAWLTRIRQVCDAYRLDGGPDTIITKAARGMNNPIFLIGDAYVIRFDGLTGIAESRFATEQTIYRALENSEVPVPQVIAVDQTRRFWTGDVMVMTRIPGSAAIDIWDLLSPDQRTRLAGQFGVALARLHAVQFDNFGRLRTIQQYPCRTWLDWADQFFGRYMIQADAAGVLPERLRNSIRESYLRNRARLNAVTQGVLVHGDAHFENVLQLDGQLTGIVDFEWALSGDPSADFQVEEQWAQVDPASLAIIYEAYQSIRPLPSDHRERAALYKLLRHLDSAVESKDSPDDQTAQGDFEDAIAHIQAALTVLST